MIKDHSIMQFNKSKNLNQLKTQCKKQNNALNSKAKLDLDLWEIFLFPEFWN